MNLSPNSEPSSAALLLKTLETEKIRRLTENRLAYYKPYPRQVEFHAAGTKHRERLLCAANQVGKTYAAAMELAAHASGQYPPWWQGYRFDRAIRAWAAGDYDDARRCRALFRRGQGPYRRAVSRA